MLISLVVLFLSNTTSVLSTPLHKFFLFVVALRFKQDTINSPISGVYPRMAN